MRDMQRCPVLALVAGAVILMVLLSGCTARQPVVPATVPPLVTDTEPPVITRSVVRTPAAEPVPDTSEDQRFVDAAEACYRDTPVIANLTTHLAFLTCMKNTPKPAGACAQSYRYNALKYTNDDDTTSGYARETHNTHLAREAFYRNLAYDALRQEFVVCR